MNRGTESNLALSLGISRAYQPWTTDTEALAIRMEHERGKAMLAEAIDHEEHRRYRQRSSVMAWLVGSWLVALVFILAAIAWGA